MSALRLKITFSVFFFTYLLFAQENTINVDNDHLQLFELTYRKEMVFYEVQNKEVQFPVMEWKEIPNPRYIRLREEAEGNYTIKSTKVRKHTMRIIGNTPRLS